MEAQTFMLWFQLDQERLADHEIEILSRVKALPGLFWTGTWTTATEQQLDNGGFLYITVNSDGSHAVMRLFPSGFLTLDLQRLAPTQLPDKPQGSSVITHSAKQNLQNNLDTKKGTLDISGVEKEFLVSGSRYGFQLYHGDRATLSPALTREANNIWREHEQIKVSITDKHQSGTKIRLERMKKHLGKYCLLAKTIPVPVQRSTEPPWPFMMTGDERLIERDFTELVFETTSRWQNIKIFKSKQCGNVLYLDDDVMIGESDLVYTETVLGLDRNDFNGKTVLILGGGDGGLLHELITRTRPAFVTMVEEEVIKACRTHMRSICGSEMDQYEGDNYKIEIDDCVEYMKHACKRHATFDYVVNDLTEFNVDKEKYGFEYDFVTSSVILELSIRVLSPEGKYLARGNTTSSTEYGRETKKSLQRMGLEYNILTKYVPSFQEMYCFIEAWKEKTPS